ncbi:hypothetical protein K438DRAFT_1753624 [Mycena galopus ATCC 62051]|nr:hypothetical protein K438DRAFT_1753624 [Mycena galopus ATCC 62051]
MNLLAIITSAFPQLQELSIHLEQPIFHRACGITCAPPIDTRHPILCDADVFANLLGEELSDTEQDKPPPIVLVEAAVNPERPTRQTNIHDILRWIFDGSASLPPNIEILRLIWGDRTAFQTWYTFPLVEEQRVIAGLSRLYPHLAEGKSQSAGMDPSGTTWHCRARYPPNERRMGDLRQQTETPGKTHPPSWQEELKILWARRQASGDPIHEKTTNTATIKSVKIMSDSTTESRMLARWRESEDEDQLMEADTRRSRLNESGGAVPRLGVLTQTQSNLQRQSTAIFSGLAKDAGEAARGVLGARACIKWRRRKKEYSRIKRAREEMTIPIAPQAQAKK